MNIRVTPDHDNDYRLLVLDIFVLFESTFLNLQKNVPTTNYKYLYLQSEFVAGVTPFVCVSLCACMLVEYFLAFFCVNVQYIHEMSATVKFMAWIVIYSTTIMAVHKDITKLYLGILYT